MACSISTGAKKAAVTPTRQGRPECLVRTLAVEDVHRDLETEAQLPVGWLAPLHLISLVFRMRTGCL